MTFRAAILPFDQIPLILNDRSRFKNYTKTDYAHVNGRAFIDTASVWHAQHTRMSLNCTLVLVLFTSIPIFSSYMLKFILT